MDMSGVRQAYTTLVVEGIAQGAVALDKTVTVQIRGVNVVCRADRALVTAAGDRVYGLRSNGAIVIIGRMHAAAPDAPEEEQEPPPPPEPTVRSGRLEIHPVETRSYGSSRGWRGDNDEVYQGQYTSDNWTGCAFYGKKPRSLAGATVTRAWIKVKRVAGGDFADRTSQLRRTTQTVRPAGAPTLTGSAIDGPRLAVNETDNSFFLPEFWAQELVDGNSGGLAINEPDGDPYMKFAGRATWSSAWVLTIEWQRTS